MEETQAGFHPVRGCLKRLQEHQADINTDFLRLRTNFSKGYAGVRASALNSILAEVIQNAPARLRELKHQLADCLHYELTRHGPHVCAGYNVSEQTITALYAEVNKEAA